MEGDLDELVTALASAERQRLLESDGSHEA